MLSPKKTLIAALAAGTALVPAAACAAPGQLIFATGAGAPQPGPLSAGPFTATGGVTQIMSGDGGMLSFAGDAQFSVDESGEVTVASGSFTATPGSAPMTVRTASGGSIDVRGGAASLAVDGSGAISGRALTGTVSLSSGGGTRSFSPGRSFAAQAGAKAVSTVTSGAARMSAIDDGPREGPVPGSDLPPTGLDPLVTGATGVPVVQNPALPVLPAGTTADLLGQVIALRDSVGTVGFAQASDALLAVQLAFLQNGGAPGAFSDAGAAAALAAYLDFIRNGGAPGSYTGANAALVQAYLAYLATTGLPSGLSQAQQQLLQTYFSVIAAGGANAAFDANTVAAALNAYVAYLANGGTPGGYSGAPDALIQAYLNYLQTLGLGGNLDPQAAAQIAAYQAIVAANGTDFSALGAANVLNAFIAYLRDGGVAADYTGASDALLRAYLAALLAFGVPDSLDADAAEALNDYLEYLAGGGEFGTIPDEPPVDPPVGGGPGIGFSTTVKSPTAISGLYGGGPSDPGVVDVVLDAQGRPTELGYFGKPVTASLVEFQKGNGWILGRFANGRFSNGTNITDLGAGGLHFAAQAPASAIPTSGGVSYSVAGFTTPTLVGSGQALDSAALTMNLGVLFGSSVKFGFDGTLSGMLNGAATSVSFSSAGGSAAPSLTNTAFYGGSLGLFGQAPVTAATGSLCASAAACKVFANFMAGGAGAATFGVGYSVNPAAGGVAVVQGAAILTQGGTVTPPPGPVGVQNDFSAAPATIATMTVAANDIALRTGAITNGSINFDNDGNIGGYFNGTKRIAAKTVQTFDRHSVAGALGWARWADGEVNTNPGGLTFSGGQGAGFIWGAPATNVATSGTATYHVIGSTTPATFGGTVVTSYSIDGTLGVDLGAMKVGWSTDFQVNGHSFAFNSAGGSAAPSIALGSAWTWTGAGDGAGGIDGTVNGFLAGPGGSYAGIGYAVTPDQGQRLFGVIAFGK